MPSREDAWNLLCEIHAIRKPSHAHAGRGSLRPRLRQKAQCRSGFWGITALLHDFDYERWPNSGHSLDREHPSEGANILRAHHYPERDDTRHSFPRRLLRRAARVAPRTHLFACDELAGFLTACAYVRPSKSILDLEVSSVKKRMKDKAFARGVSPRRRHQGRRGTRIPLDEHIAFCIQALREHADALGLRGSL